MNSDIIKHQRVVVRGSGATANMRAGSAGAEAACAARKDVRLVEHEGEVRAIELACSCGERTLIELVIDPEPARSESSGRNPS